MLAQGRLRDAELVGDEQAADAVLDQIASHLRWEVRARITKPFQDLQAPLVAERAKNLSEVHYVSLPIDELPVNMISTLGLRG